METIVPILIFFFGTIIGSFLNVVILRYRSGRGLGGRSACFTCDKKLGAAELVPIGSYLTQGGKCTGCGSKISLQYPVVEALTGFVFVALFFRFGYLLMPSPILFAVLFAYFAFMLCLLIVMSVYDVRHKILPDRLTVLFASVAFIGMFFIQGDAIVLHIPKLSQFLAGILLPAPFTALWYVSKGKWMGLGDPKLMIGIGFLLGISSGIMAILLSFWIGALFGVALLILAPLFAKGKISLKTAVPFGPFLALGTAVVVIFQLDLVSLFRFVGGL